jgi:hypothetical protein
MPSFFVSIAFSFIAWSVVAARYIWPELHLQPRAAALRPLLILHSFRFMGLAFLVPGVVSPDLPSAFARSAAYGDIIAAVLAHCSANRAIDLALVRKRSGTSTCRAETAMSFASRQSSDPMISIQLRCRSCARRPGWCS